MGVGAFVLFLLELEYSFTKSVSSCPYTKYLYLKLPISKMKGVSDYNSESVFQFLVRYGCLKREKNPKYLMIVTLLTVGYLRCSNHSLSAIIVKQMII